MKGGLRESPGRHAQGSLARAAAGLPARAIVCSMFVLAVSGKIVIGSAVSFAALLVWWLLRGEARDEAAQQAEEEAARAAAEQAVRETDEDQLSAR